MSAFSTLVENADTLENAHKVWQNYALDTKFITKNSCIHVNLKKYVCRSIIIHAIKYVL